MKMSETVTLEPQPKMELDLSALQSVSFLREHRWVQGASEFATARIERAREYRILAWIISLVQFQALWSWTLLHTIPWPKPVVSGVNRADETVTPYMQGGLSKVEMVVDYVTTKTAKIFETGLTYVSKGISIVDSVGSRVSSYSQTAYGILTQIAETSKKIVERTATAILSGWSKFRTVVFGLQEISEKGDKEETLAKEDEAKKEKKDR